MVSLPEHLQAKPVGRRRLAPEVRAEHQRERILDAATRVFAERGFQAATIDDVVAAAKVGVGSFYDLFDNKADCFVQAYSRIAAEARERIAAAVPAEAPWPEQATAALRALLELIEAEPLRAKVALVEVQTAGPEALTRHEETVDAVIPLLARGRAENPALDDLPTTSRGDRRRPRLAPAAAPRPGRVRGGRGASARRAQDRRRALRRPRGGPGADRRRRAGRGRGRRLLGRRRLSRAARRRGRA